MRFRSAALSRCFFPSLRFTHGFLIRDREGLSHDTIRKTLLKRQPISLPLLFWVDNGSSAQLVDPCSRAGLYSLGDEVPQPGTGRNKWQTCRLPFSAQNAAGKLAIPTMQRRDYTRPMDAEIQAAPSCIHPSSIDTSAETDPSWPAPQNLMFYLAMVTFLKSSVSCGVYPGA
jgi:hypothetical protein